MTEVLKLGSIISIGEEKGMVIGYLDYIEDDKLKYRYVVLPYPAGYVNENSLKLFDIKDYDVVYEGYDSEYTQSIATAISGVIAASEKFTYEEMKKILESYHMEGRENE